jgi:hypothetical protein
MPKQSMIGIQLLCFSSREGETPCHTCTDVHLLRPDNTWQEIGAVQGVGELVCLHTQQIVMVRSWLWICWDLCLVVGAQHSHGWRSHGLL